LINRLVSSRWDTLLPLGAIAVFALIAIPVATGAFDFGLSGGDAERFHTIYTEIGIQTTAGVFAIVISLSLVAIQVAAQDYSHRIMEYYIKSTVFWSTSAVYLGLMITTIFLQGGSTDDDSPRVVGMVLLGSVLALVLLVPHFVVTAEFLKPEFIVRKLMKRITRGYLETVKRQGGAAMAATSSDRLLPVVEIAERSIERGDVATANFVVEQIAASYEAAARNGPASVELAEYFAADLRRIGRKAISQADEEPVAVQVVRAITRLAAPGVLAQSVSTVDDLLSAAVRHDQEGTIAEGIDALAGLYPVAGADERRLIADSFGGLIPRLAGDGQRRLSLALIKRLEDAISTGAPGEEAHARLLELLESIGRENALHRMVAVARAAAIAMARIATSCIEHHPETAKSIVLSMLRTERSLDRSEAETIAAVGFARAEVERLLGPRPGESDAEEFSDLWREPQQ
jgi:hypothetical protein